MTSCPCYGGHPLEAWKNNVVEKAAFIQLDVAEGNDRSFEEKLAA